MKSSFSEKSHIAPRSGSVLALNSRLFGFLAVAVFCLFGMADAAFAQNAAGAIFGGAAPGQAADSNVATALEAVLWWVYLIFKIVAIVVVGWSMLEIRNGELTKGLFGVLAAVGLFFTPAFVELAKKIGKTASGS